LVSRLTSFVSGFFYRVCALRAEEDVFLVLLLVLLVVVVVGRLIRRPR